MARGRGAFPGTGARTDRALRVLPGLVTGLPTKLDDGAEVTLSPGSAMPPVLVAGDGPAARRRAAAYGDGWICMGLAPEGVASAVGELAELAARHGRPAPRATVVGPGLDPDPVKAADQLAAYADAGAERAILAPTGSEWQRDYEFAARLREAL